MRSTKNISTTDESGFHNDGMPPGFYRNPDGSTGYYDAYVDKGSGGGNHRLNTENINNIYLTNTDGFIFKKQDKGDNCNATCKEIMNQLGITPEGATGEKSIFGKGYQSVYQLANENQTRDSLFLYKENSQKALDYIDKALEFGHPIMVGVNHTYGKTINEGTTDHYVIIVGREYVNQELRYIFWDVGTSRGESTKWYFVKQSDGSLFAQDTYRSDKKSYTITQVRRNIGKDGKIINY